MPQVNKESSNFDVFLTKLKEQSFSILILVGVMYYQNSLFTNQMNEYKSMIKQKDDQILKIIDDERTRLIEREKYLIQQRDEFIQDMKNK